MTSGSLQADAVADGGRRPLGRAARQVTVAARARQVLTTVLTYTVLSVLAVATAGPFVYMVSMSLRPNFSFMYFPIGLIPEQVSLENYVTLFQRSDIVRWLINSFFVSASVVTIHVGTASLAGYAFARGRFFGRDAIFLALVASLMVPSTVTTVPLFIIISRLGWANTYLALILPSSANVFGTFLMRQQMMTIPRDYDDAARMDGAGRLDIYWQVLLPLTKPALATIATLSFLGAWNDFLWPLVATSSGTMRTLTVGLATMVMRIGGAGFQLAGATVAFLPTFIFFLLMQRYVVQGIAITGVTGT